MGPMTRCVLPRCPAIEPLMRLCVIMAMSGTFIATHLLSSLNLSGELLNELEGEGERVGAFFEQPLSSARE